MLKHQSSAPYEKKFTKKLRIAIVRTNYHTDLVDNLEVYARETLVIAGVNEKNIQSFTAPGSWEIPLLVQRAAATKKFDAILAFGVIVKGETHHFDLIANEVASALMQMSLDYSIPVAFEVLAVYNKSDAEIRAGRDQNNKGIEAANAALQTIYELKSINK
ncbi:MAG TPA: 6,7-dimethyl-8-ribityllumazine synthase [Candidatus Saccharimonadales bacterium]|nr:6,7-dimethyl-8-ribityllumazine synthase [Candidatus Saccharimonadales bacterium]